MQPFGWPVVPEVNAISAASSAAVSTFANDRRLAVERRFERAGPAVVEVQSTRFRSRALGLRAARARPSAGRRRAPRDPRLVDDLLQLLRAEQRHRRDRDAARLDHGEPARRHHRVVRPAQQHAVAGDEPQVARPARARSGWRARGAGGTCTSTSGRRSARGSPAARRAPPPTIRSSSSARAVEARRIARAPVGRTKTSGSSSGGGRSSRAKVSTWAV